MHLNTNPFKIQTCMNLVFRGLGSNPNCIFLANDHDKLVIFNKIYFFHFQDKSIGCDYYEGWYEEIRFASYRTAAKLRALQHRTGLVHIDIWNMIEAFRENGLNTMETR